MNIPEPDLGLTAGQGSFDGKRIWLTVEFTDAYLKAEEAKRRPWADREPIPGEYQDEF